MPGETEVVIAATSWTAQLPVVAAVIVAVGLFGFYLEREYKHHRAVIGVD